MIQHKTDDKAFTGLEAAIVLIAFVVVAAVFSYVVLGAGFFTTQKAQEAVYTAVAQSTSNIQMVGQVYGIASVPASGINKVTFAISLAPGSPTLDISKMKIIFSTPYTPVLTYSYSTGGASLTQFSAEESLAGTTRSGIASLFPQNQTQITFLVNPVPKNTIVNIEIHPSVGAALPFSKTTPPSLTGTNILS